MKTIRIGNDIHIRWRIMRSGVDEDFTGKQVKVTLKDPFGRNALIDWEVDGSSIVATFWGKDQAYTGAYMLTLVENNGDEGMVSVDRANAFRLVAHQDSVVGSDSSSTCCCGGMLSVETVDLTSELQVPSLGKGVVRVYNIDRHVWGDGLETDGETVKVKIDPESADVLSVSKKGLRINPEKVGADVTAITDDEIVNLFGNDG